MRAALAFPMILVFALGSHAASAGPQSPQAAPSGNDQSAPAGFETYRGYAFDLSENSESKAFTAMADNLKSQLDIVEAAGFSSKVLKFFHSVPIVASEMACLDETAAAACYGLTVPDGGRVSRGVTTWDHNKLQWTNPDIVELAVDSGLGVVMLRPNALRHAQDPVLLHEFLHAYHAKLMPRGYENKGIKDFYGQAKAKDLFPKDAYILKDHKEFFAITASIFLSGKDAAHEPFTRDKLKETMPQYYTYLVGVFGFDPNAPAVVTPVASAD
jgi:hypothetical protein